MNEHQADFKECEYPRCKCPRHGRCGNAREMDEALEAAEKALNARGIPT